MQEVAASTLQRSRIPVLLCFLVAVLEGFDLQVAGVAGPKLAAELALDTKALGWFFSSSTIGLFFGAIAGGQLSDIFGRRLVLTYSVAAFGLFAVLTGMAEDTGTLIAARLLTGVGLGSALPNLLALTAENAEEGREKRALGMLYCGIPLGGGMVSLLSSIWTEDWRLLFFAGGVLPLLLAPLLFFSLPTGAIQKARLHARSSSRSLFEFLGQGRAIPSILLWVAFFATLVILYLVLNWLPTLLLGAGLDGTQTALVQVAFNVGGILACAATAPLLDRDRPWRIAAVAYISIVLLLHEASTMSSFMPALLIGLSLGAAVLVTQSFLYAQAPLLYPPTNRGIGIGVAIAVGRLGSIAGPMIGAALVSTGGASSSVLIGIVPIAVVAGLSAVALSLVSRQKRERRD